MRLVNAINAQQMEARMAWLQPLHIFVFILHLLHLILNLTLDRTLICTFNLLLELFCLPQYVKEHKKRNLVFIETGLKWDVLRKAIRVHFSEFGGQVSVHTASSSSQSLKFRWEVRNRLANCLCGHFSRLSNLSLL